MYLPKDVFWWNLVVCFWTLTSKSETTTILSDCSSTSFSISPIFVFILRFSPTITSSRWITSDIKALSLSQYDQTDSNIKSNLRLQNNTSWNWKIISKISIVNLWDFLILDPCPFTLWSSLVWVLNFYLNFLDHTVSLVSILLLLQKVFIERRIASIIATSLAKIAISQKLEKKLLQKIFKIRSCSLPL